MSQFFVSFVKNEVYIPHFYKDYTKMNFSIEYALQCENFFLFFLHF